MIFQGWFIALLEVIWVITAQSRDASREMKGDKGSKGEDMSFPADTPLFFLLTFHFELRISLIYSFCARYPAKSLDYCTYPSFKNWREWEEVDGREGKRNIVMLIVKVMRLLSYVHSR